MAAALIGAMLWCLAGAVGAQSTFAIPVDVEFVTIGGSWTSGREKGIYRVIVVTSGAEKPASRLQIDWITEAGGASKPARVAASKVAETRSWRLGKPRMARKGERWSVVVDGADTQITPSRTGTWRIELGEPGMLKTTLKQ
jgi:hypothetical protein